MGYEKMTIEQERIMNIILLIIFAIAFVYAVLLIMWGMWFFAALIAIAMALITFVTNGDW